MQICDISFESPHFLESFTAVVPIHADAFFFAIVAVGAILMSTHNIDFMDNRHELLYFNHLQKEERCWLINS